MTGKPGPRQSQLLRLLLTAKGGLNVAEMSRELAITRNAVRQHLAVLERDGLIAPGATRPSGGRPQQLYVLTPKGLEVFPRHYSWFAQLVVDGIVREHGTEGLGKRLTAIGQEVGTRMRAQHPAAKARKEKVDALVGVMNSLGYNSRNATGQRGAPTIEANNCVFHELAMRNPDVCRFDLSMMGTFTDSQVSHEECMARGGNVCRFKLTPKS